MGDPTLLRRNASVVFGSNALLTIAVGLALLLAPTTAVASVEAGPADEPLACGDAANPCKLDPGTTRGELVRGANGVDYYHLDPPGDGSIVHLGFEDLGGAGAYSVFLVELEDPTGIVRDRAVGAGTLELSTVGAPDGDWRVRVSFHDATFLELPPWGPGPDVPFPNGDATAEYDLSLDNEPVDHVRFVHADGSPAPTLQFETGRLDTRMDLYYDTRTSVPGNNSWGSALTIREDVLRPDGETDQTTAAATSLLSRVPFSNTEVWTKGTVADELGGEVRVEPAAVTDQRIQFVHAVVDTDPAEVQHARVSLGLAYSDGIGSVHGWLAWNDAPAAQESDPGAPNVTFEHGNALFAATDDFQAGSEGTAVRAGPASAARDLTASYEAPEGMAHSILVRATNIANHAPEPRFNVSLPNGTSEDLQGDKGVWALDGTPSGTWEITMEERVGAEYGQMWVGAASFPLLDYRDTLDATE